MPNNGGRRNDSPMPVPGFGQIKRKRQTNGCHKKGRLSDTRYITVMFDTETFNQIRDYALKQGVSFAEANRRLAEWGLEDAKVSG